MSDTRIVLETVKIIQVGIQGPPGPQGEQGESGLGGIAPETKTTSFAIDSTSAHAYRCTATLTATMPNFATAAADILIEIKAVGGSTVVTVAGDATFDGEAGITLSGSNKEGVRLRKGATEWEVWG
ncbi:MAG: hypothetical protein K2Y22_04230 [Candidatus Obscuribacterales bacterium]|nr:hypothetical protein [Candidatus Obscuribacterales bacterium]